MKEFSRYEIAALRRNAANVLPWIVKKNKLAAQLEELHQKYLEVEKKIEAFDNSTKIITDGYGTEDIFERVVVDTGKMDKDGNSIKKTEYAFKFPDTIIPPVGLEEVNDDLKIDGDAVVDEIETPATDAPFNPLNV